MTPDVAIKLGEQLLKEQGLVGWRVCCDADATETCNYYASLGEPGADVVAHCDSSRKIIYLLPSYVPAQTTTVLLSCLTQRMT